MAVKVIKMSSKQTKDTNLLEYTVNVTQTARHLAFSTPTRRLSRLILLLMIVTVNSNSA